MDCDPKSHRHRRWLSYTGGVIWKRFLCIAAVLRGKKGLGVSQVTLRSLTDDGLMRFALWGNDWGFDPGNSHRGAVLCLRQTRPLRERASAPCDFRFPSR